MWPEVPVGAPLGGAVFANSTVLAATDTLVCGEKEAATGLVTSKVRWPALSVIEPANFGA